MFPVIYRCRTPVFILNTPFVTDPLSLMGQPNFFIIGSGLILMVNLFYCNCKFTLVTEPAGMGFQ